MKTCIFFLALSVLGISCADHPPRERTSGYKEAPVTREDSLFQQVMDGHDAAMAKMGKLAGLRKKVGQQIDSLSKKKSASDEPRIVLLKDVAQKLQASEQNMNAWMEGFSIDSLKDEPEKRTAYLESEKVKVYSVRDELLANVARADSLVKGK